MQGNDVIQGMGMVAAIVLPLWNIPLIVRIHQRKSSHDVSLWWAFGVLGCMLLMLPSALLSPDPVYKVFMLVNLTLFTTLVVQIVHYH